MLEASLLQVCALLLGVIALFAAALFGIEIQRLRTERARLLRELEKRSERLKSAETDREALRAFALLDMPGQVATIEGYAKRLISGEAGKLPEKASAAAGKIAAAAKRLSQTLAQIHPRR